MTKAGNSQIMRIITFLITIFYFSLPAYAKYSGGTGEPDDPYQITTAEDFIKLGDSPEDYNKHFILTADINLDPNLPDRKVFSQAVIAADTNDTDWDFQGTPFSGDFNGNKHTISNLTITGVSYLGLFGQLDAAANISNLGLETVEVTGTRSYVGGLAGENDGSITSSYSTGLVKGFNNAGGLVGKSEGSITSSYSTSLVTGNYYVGGLVGENDCGSIKLSYSHGLVTGYSNVGGLVGNNKGTITSSYSTGLVTANSIAGGLVGVNDSGSITSSFWDTEASGLSDSDGGIGLTTNQMQDINTFLVAYWDFTGENSSGDGDFWQLQVYAYPVLAIFLGTEPTTPQGSGLPEDPYLITNVNELYSIWYRPTAHYRLETDIDLSGINWNMALIPWFNGHFNGNGHVISHLSIQGENYLGLFGHLGSSAKVTYLGLENVSVSGIRNYVGAIVGYNLGSIVSCYSNGSVDGSSNVGGLVGSNYIGYITSSYSDSKVSGSTNVGGLVGVNDSSIIKCSSSSAVRSSGWNANSTGGLVGRNKGSISASFSTCSVNGQDCVGGLVGSNGFLGGSQAGRITDSYATGDAFGGFKIGGLVGYNTESSSITQCYSIGKVSRLHSGGLVGDNWGNIVNCFWNVETSGNSKSEGGVGLTTSEAQNIQTYLAAGWDFAGESYNGVAEVWIMPNQGGYPVLAAFDKEYSPPQLKGKGTPEDPYVISTAAELVTVQSNPDANYRIIEPIDLSNTKWSSALVPIFNGVFDGNGFKISSLHIEGGGYLGLFGELGPEAIVMDLHLENAIVNGNGTYIGALTGYNNRGHIQSCIITATVSGYESVGGLVGNNLAGSIIDCGSLVSVDGRFGVGGLVGGNNSGEILNCYSTGTITGYKFVGGLVATNVGDLPGGHAKIRNCYSTCNVQASHQFVGGLVGHNGYYGDCTIINCYSAGSVSTSLSGHEQFLGGLVGGNWDVWDTQESFWDTEASGLISSAGGIGSTTLEMQTASTFLEAGWDFMDETDNGTEDIWWILEGQDYPRLWWEAE
jgi:hypothetical protein